MKRLLFIPLILILGLVVFAQTQKSYKAEVSVYFSPKVTDTKGCQDAIIEQIKSAEKSIYVAMYFFTNQDLADALVRAEKKVPVKVILDKGQENYQYAKGNLLKDVRYYSPPKGKGQYYPMHHKFAVIDEKIVITGSYNWTDAAETSNNENLLIIRSPDIAAQYIKVWNEIK